MAVAECVVRNITAYASRWVQAACLLQGCVHVHMEAGCNQVLLETVTENLHDQGLSTQPAKCAKQWHRDLVGWQACLLKDAGCQLGWQP